jgi:hypothetical protein
MAAPDFLTAAHDPRDPNPWQALYLDRSTPVPDDVKQAWLVDCSSRSRQFLLPLVRPFARLSMILIQLVRIVLPRAFASSSVFHALVVWGLRNFVRPEANWLILRHFHLGSEILDFLARNTRGVAVATSPLRPSRIEDLRDHVFVRHDLNLYNFVIALNGQLRARNLELAPVDNLDFSGVTDGALPIGDLPRRWTNFIDLHTAIEMFAPMYQLFLTDNDFWRASNSLQLDETIAIYAATLAGKPAHLFLVNNKHPLVAEITMTSGWRLVLHGMSTETLHAMLVQEKRRRAADGLTGTAQTRD